MSPRSKWLVWSSVTLASFGAIEAHALSKHVPYGTLSEVIQATIGVHPRAKRRWLLIPIFVGFLAWFCTHILSEPVQTTPWER